MKKRTFKHVDFAVFGTYQTSLSRRALARKVEAALSTAFDITIRGAEFISGGVCMPKPAKRTR